MAVAACRVERRSFRPRRFCSFRFRLALVELHELGMRLQQELNGFQTAVLGRQIKSRFVADIAVTGIGAVLEQDANDARVSVLSAAV